MHRIKLEWIGTSPRGGPRYRAHVIRVADGAVVWTSEASPSGEEAWLDAAQHCRQNGLEVRQ